MITSAKDPCEIQMAIKCPEMKSVFDTLLSFHWMADFVYGLFEGKFHPFPPEWHIGVTCDNNLVC